MNEKKERKMVVIDINLTRSVVALVIAGLILVAAVGYLTLGNQGAAAADLPASAEAPAAPAASSNGLRRYYRTVNTYTPPQALTACAIGYHFASFWEIMDPSNLEYANDHPDAYTLEADMGEGPPTGSGGFGRFGWIRTGYNSSAISGVPGQDNCSAWFSTSGSDYGTVVSLSYVWGAGTTEDLFVWDVALAGCDYPTGVWCVED
ncbi:MAG: hypothetical protein JW918_15950 [Anaerolineae bacterium]|nr:hypothetical protein [Anaerolineae bacterium]